MIIMRDNKLVTTTEPKFFHFGFSKYAGINMKHQNLKHHKTINF